MINWRHRLAASCLLLFRLSPLITYKIKLSQSDGGPLAHFFIVFFKGFWPALKKRHS